MLTLIFSAAPMRNRIEGRETGEITYPTSSLLETSTAGYLTLTTRLHHIITQNVYSLYLTICTFTTRRISFLTSRDVNRQRSESFGPVPHVHFRLSHSP